MFRRLQQSVGACVCVMMLTGVLVGSIRAGMKEMTEQVSPAVVGAGKKSMEKPSTKQGAFSRDPSKRLSVGDRKAQATQRHKHAIGSSSSRRSKTLPRAEVTKTSKATLMSQPSQRDLAGYGLLETLQRYDPRLNHRTAGMPIAQTPDITRDHFFELDRNRDGHVDPVERAFGRLDMERDFQPR